jgi:amidase
MPQYDATVVARLRAAGAIILGKTNMPELGLAFETDNLIYGRTNNPYSLSCTPGGSSGGEAAIIAAGGSPLGLGNDMGGSIRLPAHFCGITGIKPTAGRVPKTGVFPLPGNWLAALWHIGPMARFVSDLALTLPIIMGVDWNDPSVVPMPLGDPTKVNVKNLRASFHTDNGIMPPTPETVDVVESAAKALSDAGVSVEETRPKCIERSFEIFSSLGAADGGASVEKLLQTVGTTEIHPWVQALLAFYHTSVMTTSEFSHLMMKLFKFRSSMLSSFEKYDVMICPACAYPAQPHGATLNAENIPAFSYTMAYNLTGWPSVVVRGGTSPENLPIGVQVVARPWREDVALAVASRLEAVLGGWRPPSL